MLWIGIGHLLKQKEKISNQWENISTRYWSQQVIWDVKIKNKTNQNTSVMIYRYSPTIWCLCAFSPSCSPFMCPSKWKIKINDNFMCLLEFECAKRLKAHSQTIPEYILIITINTYVRNREKLFSILLNLQTNLLKRTGLPKIKQDIEASGHSTAPNPDLHY